MGVIQQSFNQAISIAGLANQIRQQSPNYQKKMQAKEELAGYERYEAAKKEINGQLKSHPENHVGNEELKDARDRLNEGRANELYSQGRYEDWTRQIVRNAQEKKNWFGRIPSFSEYDEEIAQEANQRAEDTTRQIIAQRDAYKSVLDQLKGVNQVSQAFLHKEGNK